MKPAREPPSRRGDVRLLAIDPALGRYRDAHMSDLPELLRAGDLLVVNDAATLPASLPGVTTSNDPIELRLLGPVDRVRHDAWRAVLFGAGDWRTPTEHRPAPPAVHVGSTLQLHGGLHARVTRISPQSPRLIDVRFDRTGAELWAALYAAGAPVQYAYLRDPLALWSAQTVYGARPWAAEMPSAGRPLTWSVLLELRRRGVALAALTHAAGLSSTGDDQLDAALPLPERFDIPRRTVEAINRARACGGRVIAVGTTVVRALEGSADSAGGDLIAGPGETDLVITADFRLRVVDGLLTGVHDPTESHFKLLSAFADREALTRAWHHAAKVGYHCHELGDSSLILPWTSSSATDSRAAPMGASTRRWSAPGST